MIYLNTKKMLQLRHKKELDLRELAAEMGVVPSCISQIESDTRPNPTIQTVISYCMYFGLTPTELLTPLYRDVLVNSQINRLREMGMDQRAIDILMKFYALP
jgi:DNA-binding XRE family transcriptional regulator